MTQLEFVAALKKAIQEGVDHEVMRLCSSVRPTAAPHLIRFSEFLRRLSDTDKETAHDLMRFVAEGGLFRVLVYLDNMSQLGAKEGQFELWHIAADGDKIRINDPDGELLNDLFNEVQ